MATAKKNDPKATETATYTVISPLDHDGERYEPDEDVELTAAQAAPLLAHTVQPKEAPAAG